MNGHIWKVFSYEISRFSRRRGYLFTTFGIPLIALLLLLGYKFISDANAQNAVEEEDDDTLVAPSIDLAGYVDQTGLFSMSDSDEPTVLIEFADEESARAAMVTGEIDAYFIIPPDYLETGEVTFTVPTFSFNYIVNAEDLITGLIYDRLAGDVDPALLARLRAPTANIIEMDTSRLDAEGEPVPRSFDSDFGIVYVFAIALMLGVFTTNGYLMQGVIDEKENRLIEVLLSSVRPTELLAGKILAMGLMGLLQVVVWMGSLFGLTLLAGNLGIAGTPLDNVVFPLDIMPLLLAYFIFGYLFFAAAYGAVGALSNSLQEGPQYAVIFTLPAALPLYFIGVFLTSPNDPLPVAMSIFPITAPLAMVMRLVLTTVPTIEIIISLVLLVITDIALMWVAGRLFRVSTLLAGKLPKLREIPALLRG